MRLRRQAQGLGRFVFLAVLLLLCIFLFYGLSNELFGRHLNNAQPGSINPSSGRKQSPPVNQYCEDRYGVDYLKHFRKNYAQYCSVDPKKATAQSRLHCLSNNVDPKGSRTDSFCIAKPASFDTKTRKFNLNCQVRSINEAEKSNGVQSFNHLPAYWYETGPRYIFDHYFNINAEESVATKPPLEHASTAILIKRENANFNMWHSLMEIMSAYWSLLVLSQTKDSQTGKALYSYSANTSIYILDDIPDGPYFDLWSLVAPSHPTRLPGRKFGPDRNYAIPLGQVIVPLPGGSNPLWQGDWTDLDCTSAKLLGDFSKAVLNHYDIQPKQPVDNDGTPVMLTYINRSTKRRLIEEESYIAALRQAHPYVNVNMVDYAEYPFKEQIKISAKTDILVGVHGAGLTHAMFMPAGSTIVELMPFDLDYRGFKNMAVMRGINYYQAKSEDNKDKTKAQGDWQEDDVYVNEDVFLSTVGEAIKNMQTEKNGGWIGTKEMTYLNS